MSKYKLSLALIISFLIVNIKTDRPEDYKCFDPTSDKLKVGEFVILCIHIINDNNGKGEKVGIKIKVDEYSVISIDEIYKNYNQKIVSFLAQVGDTTSVFTSVSKKNIIYYNRDINLITNIFLCTI